MKTMSSSAITSRAFAEDGLRSDLFVYVTHCWGEATEKHDEAFAISKAFDRVWRASLLGNLPAFGVPVILATGFPNS